MLACSAENDGGHRHQGQKWVISSCSQSFHSRSNHVNNFIWPLSGSLCSGSMEFGLVGRKKCPQGVEILPIWPWRVMKSAKYHHRMCPTAIGSRYCLVFPLSYDTWQAVEEKFLRGFGKCWSFGSGTNVSWRLVTEFSTDLSGYQGILLNEQSSKFMHGDSIVGRYKMYPFDLYPHAKVAMNLWGAKGPTGFDLRSHFYR